MNFKLIFLSLCLTITAAHARDVCDVGAPANDDVAAELAAWDFLIGPHAIDVRVWQDGEWSDPVATVEWNGWWGLGGRAVIDEWFGPHAEGAFGNDGVNVRVWDGEAEVWRMTWQQTRGSVAAIYEARVEEDGFLHMEQTLPEEEQDTDAWFEPTGDGTWSRIQRVRAEDGEWQMQFRLDATPLSCD